MQLTRSLLSEVAIGLSMILERMDGNNDANLLVLRLKGMPFTYK
jgi:hypothetical protein